MKRLSLLALGLAVLPAPTFAQDAQLKEVTVTHQRPGEKPKLRDEVVATETLTARDIEKTGATMLTEALDKKPGVAMQLECAICNVRNVVLNNLPGRYTTLMIDGIPIFSSVSTAYGLDSVSLGGLERIDIARGAGVSLIAPEALSGAVNIVTRRPTENEFKLTQQIGQHGAANTEAFAARAFLGGALTANVIHGRHDGVDNDGNRVSEFSDFRRNLGGLGFFADDVGGFKLKGRIDSVDEKRMGGALGRDYGGVKADGAGNPFDWSKGPNGSPDPSGWIDPGTGLIVPYNDGRAGLSEIIFTDRTQLVMSGTRKLGAGTMRLALGYAKHKQDSFYGKSVYLADQDQYYLEASTQQPLGGTLVTAGFSYRYEDLESRGTSVTFGPNDGIDNYEYKTPGLFFQGYRTFFGDRLEANGSIRFDKHNVFGMITSPRVNLLWHHDAQLNSRFSLGKGYRAPTSFFEQDHGILDTGSIVREIKKPEVSHNLSYTLSFAADRLAWNGGFHYNKVHNMALLDVDGTLPGQTLFTSAESPVVVRGLDFTLTYKLTPNLEGTVAAEKTHYRFDPGTLVYARPEERVYLVLDYNPGPIDLMARATWTGKQDLARFYDYANNPRHNFDGTPKLNKSPSFWLVDVRGEYRFGKRWSGFAGIDNVFDYKQSDQENFLWIDDAGNLDVNHVWAPNRGRHLYVGVKFAL
ncbi:MAG: TonB-dependent receptor [Sulfuritalea sp.]|nr:TonB-dependent receptor [Sulfuritalea sp.]